MSNSKESQKSEEKRFQVFNGTEKVHESQTRPSADKKISELQKEKVPSITLKDTKSNKTVIYSKSRHEKNYRVR